MHNKLKSQLRLWVTNGLHKSIRYSSPVCAFTFIVCCRLCTCMACVCSTFSVSLCVCLCRTFCSAQSESRVLHKSYNYPVANAFCHVRTSCHMTHTLSVYICPALSVNLYMLVSDILQCSESGVRVHESDYPHTYNPNMALVSLTLHEDLLHSPMIVAVNGALH